jgi:predicted ATP-grasp superfamily ATP-dependent carboligase
VRIFVYELICAGGLGPASAPTSLQAEGRAMLATVTEDLASCEGVQVITLIDERLPEQFSRRCYHVSGDDEAERFRQLAADADFTLVIAPEFDSLLARRARWVLEAGGRLLGPDPAAIELTADKLTLAEHLRTKGIPTPPVSLLTARTSLVDAVARLSPSAAYCLKPRFGAGSQAVFVVHGPEAFPRCLEQARTEVGQSDLLLQPFVSGQPASTAFLTGPAQQLPLAPAAQHLSDDGRLRYLGGAVPLPAELAARALGLAKRAVDTVAGLRGYLGVDLVLGVARDGSQDFVIEINPRLTTSYIGLRRLAQGNLAELMLRVVQGQHVPAVRWKEGEVRFQADGSML